MRNFSIIVATSDNNGIGFAGGLPWPKNATDMSHFARTTTAHKVGHTNAIIMGLATYMSIGRPLPGRINCVITKTPEIEGVLVFDSLAKCLEYLGKDINIDKVFVIGGGMLYREAIQSKFCTEIIRTKIRGNYQADVFFPEIPDEYCLQRMAGDVQYFWKPLRPNTGDEKKYLQLIGEVLRTGHPVGDRTGVGTLALFGKQLKYSVRCVNPYAENPKYFLYEIPLMTTKHVYVSGIFWELIWFLKGLTNSKWLEERNVNIWTGNTSKEYLKQYCLDYPEGEAGPIYGQQWRNWNNEGIDQFKQIVDTLRKNPASRRMVMSSWNPSKIDKMALPPCHMTYTFSTVGGVLNCAVDIRSNDMFLGHPFNVMSTAFLLIFIGRITGFMPGEIAINITDCHVYRNHVEQVREQISREPYQKPLLQVNADLREIEDIERLDRSNIIVSEYSHWPKIHGDMAA